MIIATIGILFGSCTSGETSSSVGLEVEMNPQQLYTRYCMDCHGEDGTLGLSGAKDLTKSVMTQEQRIHIITHGSENGRMSPFGEEHYGDLNPQQVEVLAKHLEHFRK